jgi:hypothetical protein
MASQQQTVEWLQRQRQKYINAGLDPNQPDIFFLQGYHSIEELLREVQANTPRGQAFQKTL